MAQVDFYILPDDNQQARWLFGCRLVEKAWKLGLGVEVQLDTPAQAQAFDELLWTFKPESFIPHQRLGDARVQVLPLTADGISQAASGDALLLNLSDQLPDDLKRFARLSEVVVQEAGVLAASRARFSAYKQQGHSLNTHKL